MGEGYLFYKCPPFSLEAQAIVGSNESVVIRFLSPDVTIQATAGARFIICSTRHFQKNNFISMPLFKLVYAGVFLGGIDSVRIGMVNEIQLPRRHPLILDFPI